MITYKDSSSAAVPPIVHDVLRAPGRPLEPSHRASLEPLFGRGLSRMEPRIAARMEVDPGGDRYEREAEQVADAAVHRSVAPGGIRQDFSHVRIHTDAKTAEAARHLNARAFTVGRNVVFGAGEYAPQTHEGGRLLAHELAHVTQQSGSLAGSALQRDKKKGAAEWVPDGGGSLYYKTKKEAEARLEALKKADPEAELRVASFHRKGETFWRVERRTKDAAAPAAPSAGTPQGSVAAAGSAAVSLAGAAAGMAAATVAEVGGAAVAGAAAAAAAAAALAGSGTRTFALTFDDGPHAAPLGKGDNRTEKVLDVLKARGIKAGFFVQTAALNKEGNKFRGSHPIGTALIKRMHAEGHKVGIHTGGTRDHELHTTAEKAGRLEGELQSAKKFVAAETGETPTLVRPPTGALNKAVEATYAKVSLTNLLWDMDGDQGKNLPLATLKARVRSEMLKVQAGGWKPSTPSPNIVVLYHDIQKGTADNIGTLIDHIKDTTQDISGKKETAAFAAP